MNVIEWLEFEFVYYDVESWMLAITPLKTDVSLLVFMQLPILTVHPRGGALHVMTVSLIEPILKRLSFVMTLGSIW